MATISNSSSSPQWVFITGGKHKGKTLRFVKRTEHKVCVLEQQRDDDDDDEFDGSTKKNIYLNPEHVTLLNDNDDDMVTTAADATSTMGNGQNGSSVTSTPNPPPIRPAPPPPPRPNNTWVRITKGKHKGKTVRYIKHTAQRIAVQLEQGKLIYLIPDHVDIRNDVQTTATSYSWQSSTPPPPAPVVAARPVTPNVEASANSAYDSTPENAAAAAVVVEAEEEDDDDFATAIMEKETYDFVSAVEDLCSYYYDTHGGTATTTTAATTTTRSVGDDCPNTTSLVSSGDRVYIQSGTHSGKMAIFVKNTAQRVAVKLEGESKIRYLLPNSIVAESMISKCPSSLPPPPLHNDEHVNDDDPMVRAIRHHLPQAAIRVENVTASKRHRTLFGVIFGQDAVFFDMDTASLTKLPKKFVVPPNDHCQTYFLAGVKLHEKAKSLTCTYLCASSNEQVANRLLSIGAFNKLIARKVAARLELLLSTAAQADHIHVLNPSHFTFIPEQGNVGCGFIPRDMIDRLLGRPAPDVCALQVRIVVPTMGIFKGMLMEKPGIRQIELPSSMEKVDAAAEAVLTAHMMMTGAWIMVNQTGIYPYEARIQQHANSFQDVKEIPLMARWMLTQKGVSQTYLQQPNRQHSNLVGVADPTDAIPSGCVFISGIQNQLDEFNKKVVLISRFPMTEASDGRLVPILLGEKPHSMSDKDWEFLCSKPFGLVVFGNPPPGGERSMPEQIAQGDLDGDGYFICWDPCILQDAVIGDRPLFFAAKNNNHNDPPAAAAAAAAAPLNNSNNNNKNNNWWAAAQEYMANVEARKQFQKVVGRLHDCWLRKLCSNLQQDALAYGRAYKEALVTAKHGGKVNLPSRLWSEIPQHLHGYL